MNVHLLKNSPHARGILSSKAVGEPPLLLSVSALSAVQVRPVWYRQLKDCFRVLGTPWRAAAAAVHVGAARCAGALCRCNLFHTPRRTLTTIPSACLRVFGSFHFLFNAAVLGLRRRRH